MRALRVALLADRAHRRCLWRRRDKRRLRPVGIAYRCDADLGCTFVVWDGAVTPDQWRKHVARIVGDPGFPPGPLLLGDLSTVGDAPTITTDVIAEMVGRWRPGASDLGLERCGIVATGALEKARQFVLDLEGA